MCDHSKLEVRTRVRADLNLDVRGACMRPKKWSQPMPCYQILRRNQQALSKMIVSCNYFLKKFSISSTKITPVGNYWCVLTCKVAIFYWMNNLVIDRDTIRFLCTFDQMIHINYPRRDNSLSLSFAAVLIKDQLILKLSFGFFKSPKSSVREAK